jgi:hypothetical protein
MLIEQLQAQKDGIETKHLILRFDLYLARIIYEERDRALWGDVVSSEQLEIVHLMSHKLPFAIPGVIVTCTGFRRLQQSI